MTHRRRALLIGATVACLLTIAFVPGSGAAGRPPASDRAWLGDWQTNFGELRFYSLEHTDVTWDTSGAEHSTCREYMECRYGWLLRGTWHWPGHGWVPVKGFADGKEPATMEPCWVAPLSVDVPGASGDACYAMLLHRYRDEERGGFWKACFLQELCTDHHNLHGRKRGPVWRVRFSFLQRGRPDGHRVVATQTGGAGTVLFSADPSRGEGVLGGSVPGTGVFHVDAIGAAPEPQYAIAVRAGRFSIAHEHARVTLELRGTVVGSNDERCSNGASVQVTLRRGRPGDPARITLAGQSGFGPGCETSETFTSTDSRRVSVHIDLPQREG